MIHAPSESGSEIMGHRRPGRGVQVQIKYLLDRLAGVLLLVGLAPVMLLLAVAVKLDSSGPIFFRQPRVGLDRRLFTVWKFRTMIVDADRLLDARGRTGSETRITRVGRVLRSLSLDELPQILNIVRGQMSFIGPRPVLTDHLARYSHAQMQRFAMKPGVTGLAQVNGRNTLPWTRRIAYDIEYITNYSLLLDARILLRTVRTVVLREGIVLDRNPEEVDDLPPPGQGAGGGALERTIEKKAP